MTIDRAALIYQCGCKGTEPYCPTHGVPPFGIDRAARDRLVEQAEVLGLPLSVDYQPTGPCGAKMYRDQILDCNRYPVAVRPNAALLGPGKEARQHEMEAAQAIAAICNAAPALAEQVNRLEEKVDELECTLDDEEAAHRDTARLWELAKAERDEARQQVAVLRKALDAALSGGTQ